MWGVLPCCRPWQTKTTTCIPWLTSDGDAPTGGTHLQCLKSGLRRHPATLDAHILPFWQVAYIAISACLQCEPEPGDIRAMALLATLSKRLSLACAPLPAYVRELQVRVEQHAMPGGRLVMLDLVMLWFAPG